MTHLGETISYDTVFYQVPADLVAERHASGAADSRSEARAEAIGGRLQAIVRHGLGVSFGPSSR